MVAQFNIFKPPDLIQFQVAAETEPAMMEKMAIAPILAMSCLPGSRVRKAKVESIFLNSFALGRQTM